MAGIKCQSCFLLFPPYAPHATNLVRYPASSMIKLCTGKLRLRNKRAWQDKPPPIILANPFNHSTSLRVKENLNVRSRGHKFSWSAWIMKRFPKENGGRDQLRRKSIVPVTQISNESHSVMLGAYNLRIGTTSDMIS